MIVVIVALGVSIVLLLIIILPPLFVRTVIYLRKVFINIVLKCLLGHFPFFIVKVKEGGTLVNIPWQFAIELLFGPLDQILCILK